MNLTQQQTDFVYAVTAQDRNIALIARAGTGKTSTILAGVDALRETSSTLSIIVCAYNKAIGTEISAKLKERGHDDWKLTQARTAHSLGNSLVAYAFRSPKVEPNKVRQLAWAIVDADPDSEGYDENLVVTLRQYGSQVLELVSKAKQEGVGFFDDAPISSVDTWARIAEHYDINGLDESDVVADVIEAAQHLYKLSLAQTNVIDYDDQILFPLVKNIRVKFQSDVVILDEAQDISRARFALVRKFVAPGGFLHIVGDDRQAIYGFSGADANALENMMQALDSAPMPLTVTWRCPKAVVRLAQTIVRDIEAAPDAIEGEVKRVEIEALASTSFIPGNAILCRNTAPLVTAAYGLIRRGIACFVEGRAIGTGLAKLAKRWKVEEIAVLQEKLEDYQARETQQALAKGHEQKAQEIADKVATLNEICTACQAQGKHAVSDVISFIEGLFGDADQMSPAQLTKMVTLATLHRSKGREWKTVYFLGYNKYCPSKAARQPWQQLQEQNLIYVGLTRAMESLVFIDVP